MKSILITGATGFLGSNLVKVLEGNRYKCFYAFHDFEPQIKNQVKFDLAQNKSIYKNLDEINPEIIIHAAAITRPGDCLEDPDRTQKINVKATTIISRWCQENSARLIFTSTDMVYSGEDPPYKEGDETRPVNIYGKSKLAAERNIRKILNNHVILRLSLLFGRGNYNRKYSSEWLERDLKVNNGKQSFDPIGLYTDQYRSMISVTNVANIIEEMIDNNFTGILNIGGEKSISRYEFGQKLCRKLGYSTKLIKPVKFQDIDSETPSPLNVALNIRAAKKILNTEIWSIRKGLKVEYNE